MKTTACPLDCYDACRVVVDEGGTLKGDKTHPVTRGYLCPNLNHFTQQERIGEPRLKGKAVSMSEALESLIGVLGETKPAETLYYRGSGNVGLMQRSLEHFFAGFRAVGTSGSLCDGAGEAGILQGRGSNYLLSPQMIGESEAVIVWGRNPHVTHSHLLPFLEGKTLIVIDPVQTQLAKKADLHIQIKPHCDLHLALMLSRFAMIEGSHDTEFLEKHASDFEEFYELTQTVRIKATLDAIDVSLGQIGTLLSLIHGKRTVILVGAGVQKYRNGAEVLRSIDAFGAILGLFGKSGCGVSFLGDSTIGIDNPFGVIKNRVAKPTVDFSKYNCVFVQGGNPLAQMPSSRRVRESFDQAGFTVYFGLYENETSRAADLVIPAKTFLEKNDFRSSYGDYTLQEMPKIVDSGTGIGEFELTKVLCDTFAIELENEEAYLDGFRAQIEVKDGVGYRRNVPAVPYAEGFDNGEFEFIDEIDLGMDTAEGFWLITPKYARGLNSQFHRPAGVHLHPDAGFAEGENVRLSSFEGSVEMQVRLDERLRCDCALIYAGTPDVNVLTPARLSYDGESAVYQEFKIKVEKI
ncbi:MAG: molybdopterin-dependent oxidoreductase [Campylobacterales bacterium]|nr:molybdopterin-dependent oxidoreductase [Campylobacterales bacterium]